MWLLFYVSNIIDSVERVLIKSFNSFQVIAKMGRSKSSSYTPENVVFILDIRESTPEDFKQKSIKCCAEMIKHNIRAKNVFFSHVLVGTKKTINDLNFNQGYKGYLNVVQYMGRLQNPSWKCLTNFYNFINQTPSDKGNWLDALVVSLGMLTNGYQRSAKSNNLRIVLFYDFNNSPNSYDAFENITKLLKKHNVELIVVSPNIAFIDNEDKDLPQAIFINSCEKSFQQLENEKYALRLVRDCNAKLCNLTEAPFAILNAKNKHPWTWNKTLRIGSKISIQITGIIAAKHECDIKLERILSETDKRLNRQWGYFKGDNRIYPDEDDIIDGYMLGATPKAYDGSDNENKIKLPPGLIFIGFVPRESVHDEYFSGNSLYLILHRYGSAASVKMLDALVRVLLEEDSGILCWKVYNEQFSQRRIVVLLPNEIQKGSPANLYMYEVAPHTQYNYFDFPKLASKNTQCTDEQLDAVDKLIDSMDLTMKFENFEIPRQHYKKDLLQFDKLPHIAECNFMDIMERKIMCKAYENDENFEEILNDTNLAKNYWKLPEQIKENAQKAAKIVKNVFPLQENLDFLDNKVKANVQITEQKFEYQGSTVPAEDFEQLLKGHVFPITDKAADNSRSSTEFQSNKKDKRSSSTNDVEQLLKEYVCLPQKNSKKSSKKINTPKLNFVKVGSLTPAEDFEQLLKAYVFPVMDGTQRDLKFNYYAMQIRTVLKDLIFKSKSFTSLDLYKISAALTVYRSRCFIFNATEEYNIWISYIKSEVINRDMSEFWQEVIVKHELGLCFIGEPTLQNT